MSAECLLCSYAPVLVLLIHGLVVLILGKVYLGGWSKEPIKGAAAREIGCFTMAAALIYLAVVTWAWSHFDR